MQTKLSGSSLSLKFLLIHMPFRKATRADSFRAPCSAALEQEFPQIEELAAVREKHGAVIRELQRMRKEPGYASAWTPKTAQAADAAVPAQGMRMR